MDNKSYSVGLWPVRGGRLVRRSGFVPASCPSLSRQAQRMSRTVTSDAGSVRSALRSLPHPSSGSVMRGQGLRPRAAGPRLRPGGTVMISARKKRHLRGTFGGLPTPGPSDASRREVSRFGACLPRPGIYGMRGRGSAHRRSASCYRPPKRGLCDRARRGRSVGRRR